MKVYESFSYIRLILRPKQNKSSNELNPTNIFKVQKINGFKKPKFVSIGPVVFYM